MNPTFDIESPEHTRTPQTPSQWHFPTVSEAPKQRLIKAKSIKQEIMGPSSVGFHYRPPNPFVRMCSNGHERWELCVMCVWGSARPSWTDLWGPGGKVNVSLDRTESHICSESKSPVTPLSDLVSFCLGPPLTCVIHVNAGRSSNTLRHNIRSVSRLASRWSLRFIT